MPTLLPRSGDAFDAIVLPAAAFAFRTGLRSACGGLLGNASKKICKDSHVFESELKKTNKKNHHVIGK